MKVTSRQVITSLTAIFIEARTRLEEDMHQPNISFLITKGFIVLSANYTQLRFNI